MHSVEDSRPWTFYAFAAFFGLFVLFLYGPMIVIYVLSFQGPSGGMTFPLNGVSLHWFVALVSQTRVGDIAGSFVRSIGLAAIVAVVTVALSVLAGLGFRRRFRGSAFAFYLAIASLIMPGLFVGLGIALAFRLLGIQTHWFTSGLGAQLTWTLPFGLLIMFAVLGRFNRAYEEAATDLGATSWQKVREVTLPMLLPAIFASTVLVFADVIDDFVLVRYLSGNSSTEPVSVKIYNTARAAPTPALNALATLLLFAALLAITVGYLIYRRMTRGDSTTAGGIAGFAGEA